MMKTFWYGYVLKMPLVNCKQTYFKNLLHLHVTVIKMWWQLTYCQWETSAILTCYVINVMYSISVGRELLLRNQSLASLDAC